MYNKTTFIFPGSGFAFGAEDPISIPMYLLSLITMPVNGWGGLKISFTFLCLCIYLYSFLFIFANERNAAVFSFWNISPDSLASSGLSSGIDDT